jgi:hypothetical protein
MIEQWLGGMLLKFVGAIFFLVLLMAFWFGLTLASMRFWSWLFESGRAPKLFCRIREHSREKNEMSDGTYWRFFNIIFSFLLMLVVIFVVVGALSLAK